MKKTLLIINFITIFLCFSVFAQEEENSESDEDSGMQPFATDSDVKEIENEAEEMQTESYQGVRKFHEVLDELLAEFGYDVKMGQVKGLKNLSIRRVDVSDAIPKTYKRFTQNLVTERIKENSKIKMIHCTPCMSKTSRLVEGKIIVTSPNTNIHELKIAADQLGIENFLDVVLVYHATHMILAFQIFKVETHELIWSKTYNSETIRSKYQKLAIDYSQVAKSRPGEDYKPEYRLLLGLGGAGIPNIAGTERDSTMLDLQLRSSEKFNRRRSEFGMQLSIWVTLASIIKEYPKVDGTGQNESVTTDPESESDYVVSAQPQPFKAAIGIFGLYSHNFLGLIESYSDIRFGAHIGFGSLLAVGYLAPALKLGSDIYFGRRFAVTISTIYISPSQILLENSTVTTKGGIGAEVVLSLNY